MYSSNHLLLETHLFFFSINKYFVVFIVAIFFLQGDDIYDATLNQTNVGDNNNKFYIIQVLGLSCKSLFVQVPTFSLFEIAATELLIHENVMLSRNSKAPISALSFFRTIISAFNYFCWP